MSRRAATRRVQWPSSRTARLSRPANPHHGQRVSLECQSKYAPRIVDMTCSALAPARSMLQPDRRERPRVVSHRAADAIGRIARDMTGL